MSKVEFRRELNFLDVPMTSGALDINAGDNINYNASGFGKAGADTEGEKFAGVAMEDLHVSATENATAGGCVLRIIPANCGNIVRRKVAGTRATAIPGTKVLVKNATEMSIAATTKNVAGGVIAAYHSDTECDVVI